MKFEEVVSHSDLKQQLRTAIKSGRIPHAQLFLGQEGGGNLALAIAYAQYINCTNRLEDDSCGACPSCIKYNNLAHPDLHFCFPVFGKWDVGSKPSDHYMTQFHELIKMNPYATYQEWMEKISDQKSGLINVHQANEIVVKLSLKPYEAQFQVMIIWMPEEMNTATANKLLKTLEEPPNRSIIIMVANNDEQMLSTILSRVQYVKLKKMQDMDMLAAMNSRFEIGMEKAREIVNVADGDYNQALKLAEMEDINEDITQLIREWFRTSYTMELAKLIPIVDSIAKLSREKQKSFYAYASHVFRQSLAMNNAQEVLRATTNEKQFVERFAEVSTNEKVPQIISKLEAAIYHVDRNANAKILAMNLSMDLYEVLKLEN